MIGQSSMRHIAAAALLCLLAACGNSKSAPQAPPKLPVSVAHPVVRKVTEWDQYSGRFEAVDYVEIRSRVSGYLQSINFRDGDIVKAGQLLFVIDPRPYQVALDRAKADLASARSTAEFNVKDLARARELLSRENIPQRVYDQREDAVRTSQAAVEIAEAAVRQATLDLGYTQIRSPITGRTSTHSVSVGNLIAGGVPTSTPLTTVASLDPIRFIFDADEAAYLNYVRLAKAGVRPSSRDVENPVQVRIQGETKFTHTGKIEFVDNQINAETATIRGRAIFDNPGNVFLPGMFGDLRLLGRANYPAILVPDSAIGNDQTERVIYAVGPDKKITPRQVKLGPIIDGLRVVRSGIRADDLIVINGLVRLRPDLQVEPQITTIKAPPPGSSGQQG